MATSTSYNNHSTIGLTLQVPVHILDDLFEIAKTNGTDVHDIMLDYIREGVLEAMPMVKRSSFFSKTKEILQKNNVPAETVEEFVEKFTY